jgi:low affinity Fe/Cu permease
MNTLSSVITLFMVFVLNNAQYRDTAAINTKLDAIVFALEKTGNRLIGLESKSQSEVQEVLEDLKTAVAGAETP